MAHEPRQISLHDEPRVHLEYHPERPPPDATGPSHHGVFLASLDCLHDHAGWGRTEALALADLAGRVRELAEQAPPPTGLAAIDQVIAAAQRLNRDEFANWLSERAEGPLLYER